MALGIQKLSGSGPVNVVLPDFDSAGINKPANVMGYVLTPRWPDTGGSQIEGPLQPGNGPVFRPNTGTTGSWLRTGGSTFVISFWIRIPTGGGGNIISLYEPGYLVGHTNNYNTFTLNVTENAISMEDSYGTVTHTFNRAFEINKENTGWHHVFVSYNKTTSSSLYVDGNSIGWDTAASGTAAENSTAGYLAIGIGGQRKQTQQGTNTVVSYQSLANEFDICHLGLWQSGGIGGGDNDFYPRFYDPGDTGRLGGTWTPPTGQGGNTAGTAFPYPMIWAEMDYSNSQAQPIVGAAFVRTGTFNVTVESSLSTAITNVSKNIAWQEGVSGAGSISAAT